MSDEQASLTGSMFGPYHLKRLLGRGGMGEVYEAEHTVKEWTVAVKLMSDQFSKDPVFRERMKREARIAGRLQEPHVVPIHEYGEIDGKMFMEMRLVEGTDLDNLLKRFGPLTPPRAVAVISQIASALDAAHAAGVMHRDVKPPNILITRDDFAYLVDFGIASATTDEKLTQLGTAVGTWKYMAPERFTNDEVTYRADIYALACVLHECLTGTPPFRADSAGVLVNAHMTGQIPQPSTVRSGIPKAFDAVIARGMAKKATDRYASAGDLAAAARDALSDPDQDHADNILRRSREATLPGTAQIPPPGPTVADATPPPPPYANTPPPSPPGRSTPAPYPGQSNQPWAPASGPVHTPSHAVPQYGNWGTSPPNIPVPQHLSGPAPWNQGPPAKPKRSPWPIIAAISLVFVVAVCAVGIWFVTQSDSAPPPPPDPLRPERLSALLLNATDINSVMGASAMEAGKPILTMDDSPVTLSVPACQGALYTSQDPVYSGSGYTGVSGLVSSEAGDNYDHWVNQAVVLFPSADKAKAFVQTSADKWKNCAGKTVTVTNTSKNKTYRWTFGQITGSPPKFAIMDTQEGADGWECQRSMGVANNVVIDINACGYHILNQGDDITAKIIDKIDSDPQSHK